MIVSFMIMAHFLYTVNLSFVDRKHVFVASEQLATNRPVQLEDSLPRLEMSDKETICT